MAAPKHNLFALGNNGGRPKIFETSNELRIECESFFNWCIENKQVITITGLCLYLNISRTTLHRWAKGEIDTAEEVFSNIINRAISVVENAYEQKLDTFTFGGAIFALKNINKDYWKDKTEQEVSQTITNVAASFGAAIQPAQESTNDSPINKE
jgi:DNA-packaging protein gp3